jgi:two-component system, cell cycle sensor histidine kinase and response regulator CckA
MDAQFQVLVEKSHDAVVVLSEQGEVRFQSESSARLLGYSLDERSGRSAFELTHPDDLAPARELFTECVSRPGIPIPGEHRLRHKDGSWRHIESIAVNRLDDPMVGAVVVNYRDITARRVAESALRASEERLRHIVEHAQDLIYYCDAEGLFTYLNPTATRVMRHGERDLIGRHFLSLVRADFQAAAAGAYARQIGEKISTTYFEFPAVTSTGETVWLGQYVHLVCDSDRVVVGLHAIARDISGQKNTEDGLRRSEARYRSLIQGAAYGIYRTTVDGTILDANPAIAQMLGYSVEELLQLNMSAVYKSAAERAVIIDQYHREHNQTLTTDVTWLRKDGTPIVVRLSARVVDFEDGLSCFEGVAEDITEKRALEEQLRQALKMEAVGRLARGVAHDFNNVLAAIIGCSDLLSMSMTPDSPSFEEAQEIRKAAERGASLTRQLLAFSRSQMREAKLVDLNLIVPQLDGMMERMAGDQVSVDIRVSGHPTYVRIEPGQLEQVLMNLIVNARDAMPNGGTIDVAVEPVQLDERAVLRYPGIADGAFARIAVTDTGEGIDLDMQAHIFEPFFTTKNPDKGTGLGLSIVYGIAKEAGGTIAFATEPQRGTTFEVLLPLVEMRGLEPGADA